jgi:hypothetical protein
VNPAIRQPLAYEVLCLCGQRGMGKTFYAQRWASGIVRLCFWDPLQEYSDVLGGPRITIDAFEARERAGVLYRGVLRIAVKPTNYAPREMAEQFDRFCAVCMRVGAMTVGVEETSLVASPFEVPEQYAQLLAIGRHRACSVIVLGQRFAQFPRLATAQASAIVSFRQQEPIDAKALVSRVGEFASDPEGVFGEAGAAVRIEHICRSMPKFSFIEWTPENGARIVRKLRT